MVQINVFEKPLSAVIESSGHSYLPLLDFILLELIEFEGVPLAAHKAKVKGNLFHCYKLILAQLYSTQRSLCVKFNHFLLTNTLPAIVNNSITNPGLLWL